MSERKANGKRKKRNNFGKGTQLQFGRVTARQRELERRASRRAVIGGSISAVLAVILLIGGGGYAIHRLDRQEIPETELKIRVVDAPDPVLDLDLVKRSYAYVTTKERTPDGTLLTVGRAGETPRLSSVYNAVFSDSGLQIASLADRTMKCRSDAVKPLSDMLGAFYTETGLRTIMIKTAYKPAADGEIVGEEQGGGVFELGEYLKDTDERLPFKAEGDYAWFAEHAWEYGFILRDSGDSVRYVGAAAAEIMHENSLTLGQLEGFMKEHTLDDPIQMGSDTVIYSQSANGDIAVPASSAGELVPYALYYLGSEQKTLLVAAKPTEEFYSVPPPEADYIVYR